MRDATIRKIHFLISAAYQSAVRWEWIFTNPTSRADKPAAPSPDPQPPTAEQAAALVNECWRWGDLGPYVWLAMTTGARRGELCALRWERLRAIHVERGSHDCIAAGCRWVLVVRRAIGQSVADGEIWEKDTKTHQQRHIALDSETVAVLLEHRRRCDKAAQAIGVAVTDEHFMFADSPAGTAASKPSSMSDRYKRCATRLGITTCLKNLRHYSATELITAGVDVRTVAGRLGHGGGGGTTTLKVYAAWVAAADQHASTVLLNRMPQRPAAPSSGADRETVVPQRTHEHLAASVHAAWQAGELSSGTEITVQGIAAAHDVPEYAAHRAITHLKNLGVLDVRNGHRTVVLPCPDVPFATTSKEATQPTPSPPPRASVVAASAPAAEVSVPHVLVLDLSHLGTSIRRMSSRADPTDFDALERLLRDAVTRSGGDCARVGEYEMAVHLAGRVEPVTTVVVAR